MCISLQLTIINVHKLWFLYWKKKKMDCDLVCIDQSTFPFVQLTNAKPEACTREMCFLFNSLFILCLDYFFYWSKLSPGDLNDGNWWMLAVIYISSYLIVSIVLPHVLGMLIYLYLQMEISIKTALGTLRTGVFPMHVEKL